MGITRKNAEGVPLPLIKLKDERKLFVWDSTVAIIIGFCLCFLWQDNNALIAITTAHSLHRKEDRFIVNRRRPKPNSTNTRNVLPVFGNNVFKELPIPEAIDHYNKGMGAVDNANHLRKGFTCHKPYSVKWWRPLFYWLLDTCANNSYILWKQAQSIDDGHLHKRFQDTFILQLL